MNGDRGNNKLGIHTLSPFLWIWTEEPRAERRLH
jgi:hypothetical protein